MVDRPVSTNTSTDDSIGDKFNREAQLLMGAPGHMWEGVQQRFNEMKDDPKQAGLMIAEGAAIGVGLALLTRNPTALFGAGKFIAAHPYALAAAGLGLDATMRSAPAMIDTWNNPQNLEKDKALLGHSVGAAAIDYPLFGIGGAAGAMLPETAASTVNAMRAVPFRMLGEPLYGGPQLAFADAGAGRGFVPRDLQMSLRSGAVSDSGAVVGGDAGGGFKPIAEVLAERGQGQRLQALEGTNYAGKQGKFLGEGDEAVAIEMSDGKILKIADPHHGWRESYGQRPFDARIFGEPEQNGKYVIYRQERLEPIEESDARFQQFVNDFQTGGKYAEDYSFPDIRADQVGLDSRGRVKLLDYGAVRSTDEISGPLAGDQQAIGNEMRWFAEVPEQQAIIDERPPVQLERTSEWDVFQGVANRDTTGEVVGNYSQYGWQRIQNDPLIVELSKKYGQEAIKAALKKYA